MYVIFPADEVVCLSYGRVIYLPSSPNSIPSTPPVRTTASISGSFTSAPSTSTTGSTKSRQSTVSEPIFTLKKLKPASSTKSLSGPPKPPPRKKKLKVKVEEDDPSCKSKSQTLRKQSFNDFLQVNRERGTNRERSPIIRGKSASPRNLGRDRTPFDFDSLFHREASPGRLSLNFFQEERSLAEKPSPTKKKTFFGSVRMKRVSESEPIKNMAAYESPLKELTHPGYNELLKTHNSVTFKLVRTVSDFTQQLSQMYEHHAEELQMLVANFRKRNGELRKERPACPSSLFHTWDTLLQEVEIDSQALGDIASILARQVSRPLLERSFHRKIQSRKVFTHRESYETIIAKTEEKLAKCRQEYKNAYLAYLSSPTTESLSNYFNTHNAYVQQLHATNGMLEEYGKDILPSLLQELDEIYADLSATITEAVLQGAELVSSRAMEQCKRYDGLVSQCKSVTASSDLTHLVRSLPTPAGRPPMLKRLFVPPQPPPPAELADGGAEPQEVQNDNIPPPLKDELVIDRLSAVQVKPSHDVLRKEANDLEVQIRQIQEALDTLVRIQQRSVDAALYNKANELQEDISMKRFDLRVALIHLSAINAQKELFTHKLEGDTGRERKMSSASTASMKNKWLKAFKSLKTPPPETPADKKNGAAATRELLKGDPDAHNFQEYTYKKITPCDVCSQVLRGHTRQGLRCRICKMNVHLDCQEKASKCQTKARLLRRQKSTSEIETRALDASAEEEKYVEMYSGMPTINRQLSFRDNNRLYPPSAIIESTEVDQIYQVLKQATEISNSKQTPQPPGITVVDKSNPGSSGSSGQSLNRRIIGAAQTQNKTNLAVINPAPCATSSAGSNSVMFVPNSERRRDQIVGGGPTSSASESSSMRRRLFAGMKSLTGFGSRSRQGSPGHRSISLPEKRNSQDASGTRPFGQPLCIGPQINNKNGLDLPSPPSPSPSKGKSQPPILKKNTKTKK